MPEDFPPDGLRITEHLTGYFTTTTNDKGQLVHIDTTVEGKKAEICITTSDGTEHIIPLNLHLRDGMGTDDSTVHSSLEEMTLLVERGLQKGLTPDDINRELNQGSELKTLNPLIK